MHRIHVSTLSYGDEPHTCEEMDTCNNVLHVIPLCITIFASSSIRQMNIQNTFLHGTLSNEVLELRI